MGVRLQRRATLTCSLALPGGVLSRPRLWEARSVLTNHTWPLYSPRYTHPLITSSRSLHPACLVSFREAQASRLLPRGSSLSLRPIGVRTNAPFSFLSLLPNKRLQPDLSSCVRRGRQGPRGRLSHYFLSCVYSFVVFLRCCLFVFFVSQQLMYSRRNQDEGLSCCLFLF